MRCSEKGGDGGLKRGRILRKWTSGEGGHRGPEETWGCVGTPHKATEIAMKIKTTSHFEHFHPGYSSHIGH